MRRFLLTSEKFTGTAELWFNFEGLLCRVDTFDTNMSFKHIQYLMNNIAPDVEQFRTLLPSTITVKEVAFECRLDDFKREYPYSRNYHLLDDIWPKYTPKMQVVILFRAIEYRGYCQRNTWYKPMIAATWLKREEFKNDWRKM